MAPSPLWPHFKALGPPKDTQGLLPGVKSPEQQEKTGQMVVLAVGLTEVTLRPFPTSQPRTKLLMKGLNCPVQLCLSPLAPLSICSPDREWGKSVEGRGEVTFFLRALHPPALGDSPGLSSRGHQVPLFPSGFFLRQNLRSAQ